MIPGSFDIVTAREVVGDEDARRLEAKARTDAATEVYDPPLPLGGLLPTYWDRVHTKMRTIVYSEQYKTRLARNARKATKSN